MDAKVVSAPVFCSLPWSKPTTTVDKTTIPPLIFIL